MTAFWQSSAALLWLMTWWVSPPASLADAARKEAIRREATPKAVASLSNLGQDQQEPPPAAVTMGPPPDAAPPDAPPTTGETKPGTEPKPGDPAVKDPPRTEAHWRGRITEARAVLDRDMSYADVLQVKVNSLQRDAVNLDDPLAQSRARLELNKSITELDRVREQIKAGQQQIADIQAEARRLNIPAGWVR